GARAREVGGVEAEPAVERAGQAAAGLHHQPVVVGPAGQVLEVRGVQGPGGGVRVVPGVGRVHCPCGGHAPAGQVVRGGGRAADDVVQVLEPAGDGRDPGQVVPVHGPDGGD